MLARGRWGQTSWPAILAYWSASKPDNIDIILDIASTHNAKVSFAAVIQNADRSPNLYPPVTVPRGIDAFLEIKRSVEDHYRSVEFHDRIAWTSTGNCKHANHSA